jgi:predicted glycogen debranching enzyme
VSGVRTRRYHAILLTAATPPTGRTALVNGFDAWVETARGRFPITSQRYTPDVLAPRGGRALQSFSTAPWPTWAFRLDDGTRVEQQLFVPRGQSLAALSWRVLDGAAARLTVRLFFSGRDHHQLHHENREFWCDAAFDRGALVWEPYQGLPSVVALTSGAYRHDPHWYRNFLYTEERARGLDHVEDLAAPGEIDFDLGHDEAVLLLAAETKEAPAPREDARALLERLRSAEVTRREAFATPLARAAEAYLVRRGSGGTVLAGYPWFTDWGRDTFIALRGLGLAAGRLAHVRQVLLEWAGLVSEGMLPNRFADQGAQPEYNSVDAALWYVVAAWEYAAAARAAGGLDAGDQARLEAAGRAILEGYARGTRHGIRLDGDGLLAAGEPGWQLTWMDARVDGREVTPRIGKPVEVQALWINALRIGAAVDARYGPMAERAQAAFAARFWNEDAGALFDVVDVDHVPGARDASFRPNQVLAVGGLPFALLAGERARRLVEAVERRLLTPLGLRTLAPDVPGYRGRYGGGVAERDGAYHQGTAWPWLMGPFVEAWLRVHGDTATTRAEARRRFVQPLLAHLDDRGLDHVCEVADGDAPHAPGGSPFQAWSLGELIRALALTEPPAAGRVSSSGPPMEASRPRTSAP